MNMAQKKLYKVLPTKNRNVPCTNIEDQDEKNGSHMDVTCRVENVMELMMTMAIIGPQWVMRLKSSTALIFLQNQFEKSSVNFMSDNELHKNIGCQMG